MAATRRTTLLGLAALALAAMAYADYRFRQDGEPETVTAVRRMPGGEMMADNAPRSASPTAQAPTGLHPLASLQMESLSDTVARPLFEPTRRSAVRVDRPEIVQPQTVDLEAPSLRLVGTIVGGDGRASVVLARASGQRVVRAEVGDVIDTWTVQSITPSEVMLSRGSEQHVLRMVRRPPPP